MFSRKKKSSLQSINSKEEESDRPWTASSRGSNPSSLPPNVPLPPVPEIRIRQPSVQVEHITRPQASLTNHRSRDFDTSDHGPRGTGPHRLASSRMLHNRLSKALDSSTTATSMYILEDDEENQGYVLTDISNKQSKTQPPSQETEPQSPDEPEYPRRGRTASRDESRYQGLAHKAPKKDLARSPLYIPSRPNSELEEAVKVEAQNNTFVKTGQIPAIPNQRNSEITSLPSLPNGTSTLDTIEDVDPLQTTRTTGTSNNADTGGIKDLSSPDKPTNTTPLPNTQLTSTPKTPPTRNPQRRPPLQSRTSTSTHLQIGSTLRSASPLDPNRTPLPSAHLQVTSRGRSPSPLNPNRAPLSSDYLQVDSRNRSPSPADRHRHRHRSPSAHDRDRNRSPSPSPSLYQRARSLSPYHHPQHSQHSRNRSRSRSRSRAPSTKSSIYTINPAIRRDSRDGDSIYRAPSVMRRVDDFSDDEENAVSRSWHVKKRRYLWGLGTVVVVLMLTAGILGGIVWRLSRV